MSTATISQVLETALRGHENGLCIIPAERTKRPFSELVEGYGERPTWKHFQADRPGLERLEQWFSVERRKALGIVCGRVSGGLELLEFETSETWDEFQDLATRTGNHELLDRVRDGYTERSGGGGYHLLFRSDAFEGNLKLASRAKLDHELTDEDRARIARGETPLKTLAETRGEGGFCVIAPSSGLHANGARYELLRGSLATIPTITAEERAALLNLARLLDQSPEAKSEATAAEPDWSQTVGNGNGWEVSPLDDFNQRAAWSEVLPGWTPLFERDGLTYWRRPGKVGPGASATTGVRSHTGKDRLKCFSTSTLLEADRSYDKAGAFAFLNHGGHFKVAAKTLAEKGYGIPKRAEAGRSRAKSRPKAKPASAAGTFACTDLGNAERLINRHGQDLRFCHPWGKWLVWDGARWATDDTAAVRRMAHETARSIYAEAAAEPSDDARRELLDWGQTSEKRERLGAMVHEAQALRGVPIVPGDMDQDPWLFNCANGTIDLRTGELRPHRREDLITKVCPTAYDPAAECPQWLATLDLFFKANADLIAYWQRICGYALAGVVRDHVLPIAYGRGSNGKSTVLGTIMEAMGPDYAMKAPPDMFMAKKTDSHPTDRADLFGKRLVVAIETEAGRRLNETQIKELTGGDKIRARRMREDLWEFNPTHTLVMATNHKPGVRGTDHGIWRRLRLIPFTVQVDKGQADKAMPEKLRQELPGILRWAVEGCLAWQRNGLEELPLAVEKATADYRKGQDLVGQFLEENTAPHPDVKVKAGALYAVYQKWASDGNEHVMTMRAFGEAMEERGFEKQKSNGWHYLGLRLTVPVPGRTEGRV